MHKQRIVIGAVGVLGLLSVFLPWASLIVSFNLFELRDMITAEAAFWNESVSWVFTIGPWLIILASLAAIALAVAVGERNKPVIEPFKFGVAGAGAVLALIPILIFANEIMSDLREEPLASTGFGLFLAIIAGIAVAVIPFLDPEIFNKIGGSKPTE